jgi:uncharacterized protein (TIGR03437 family)
MMAGSLGAQTWAPRANLGARLEPQGVIMHGAGQDTTDYAAYWSVMPIGRQPQIYMYYIDLDTLASNWADALKAQLLQYPGSFLIPQIGLSMTNGANASYEAQVAAGTYDTQIGYLVSGLRQLATPAYLRIGYEFNGLSWNGYSPAPYAQAFIHVTNALRAAPDIEVATVWDASADGVSNVTDYYPGDSYVDWFGLNLFPDSDFTNSLVPAFMSLSTAHNKPVLVGESTPESVGAQGGAASWTGWYADYFKFLQTNPQVKQFNYIDSDWTTTGTGNEVTWGNSQLQLPTAAYVLNLYLAELANPMVLSSATESAFRGLLGYGDTTAPPSVTNLSASASTTAAGVTLNWTPVSDAAGIARYYLYRDYTLLDFALAPPYTDLSVGLGTSSYSIAVMDRAGNMTALSPAQSVTLSQVQRVVNGGFENGLTGWQLQSEATGAAGTAVADTSSPIDGTASAKIIVTASTGTNWNLQFLQSFQTTAGLTYTVSFKARASATVTLPVAIQESNSPYTTYLNSNFTATTAATSFQYSFTAPATQLANVTFYVDNIGSATLWLDDVSVLESGANPPPSLLASGVASAASYLPGVVGGSWVTIIGANLATVASDTWSNAIVGNQLPTSLDGVSVNIGGQPAFISYVSPAVVNVVAPNLPAGPATMTITTPSGTTPPLTVNVAAQAPAFFLWPGNQAVATHLNYTDAVKPGTFAGVATTAAQPGEIVTLWATGFGATTPPADPSIVTPVGTLFTCSAVTATLGGVNAAVNSCVLTPDAAGLYQVTITVPNLPAGDYPLKVTVNGATSPNGVILSIGN